MKKLLLLLAVVAVALAAPSLASACSNLGYLNGAQRVNTKALYASDLMAAALFNEAATALSQSVRMHSRTTLPCSTKLRGVRGTYQSGLIDWYTGARLAARGSIATATRYIQRGTAKIKYATNQLKY